MAYKTPGVYIQEISVFPPSVAQVETAIPAFIGYTEKAEDTDGNSLHKIPTRLGSMAEYVENFGGNFNPPIFRVTESGSTINVESQRYFMYDSLQSFFANGGGDCYIVSVGSYTDPIRYNETSDPANPEGLLPGLNALLKYDEPTMIVLPDAMGTNAAYASALSISEVGSLQSKVLAQCAKLQDRVGIFDIPGGFAEDSTAVDNFRNNIGTSNLKYGAAYYPWLVTNFSKTVRLRDVVDNSDLPLLNTFADPSDVTLLAILNQYKAELARSNKIVELITGISDFRTFDKGLLENFIDLVDAVKQSDDTTAFSNLLKVITLIRDCILLGQNLRDAAAFDLGDELSKTIDFLTEDENLTTELVKFIQLEKSAGFQEVTAGDDIDTLYGGLDGDTNGWFDTGVTVASLTADGFDFSDAALPDDQKAIEAIHYLMKNINYASLLSSADELFETAVHYEDTAQGLLQKNIPYFNGIIQAIIRKLRLIPPAATMAGIYSMVDNTRGVWKAPANVSVNAVIGPAFKIDSKEQENLNVHTTGKSINVIRNFIGKGTLVWGARTLAGNDNEWRYISVRRFYNMVEESTKKASEQFVFEPNDANTWVKVRSMIENFLILQWRAGALAGAKPEDAFFVKVGLGETMTSLDILEGRMNIEIGMAVVRPAEFIILKFSHKMAES